MIKMRNIIAKWATLMGLVIVMTNHVMKMKMKMKNKMDVIMKIPQQ